MFVIEDSYEMMKKYAFVVEEDEDEEVVVLPDLTPEEKKIQSYEALIKSSEFRINEVMKTMNEVMKTLTYLSEQISNIQNEQKNDLYKVNAHKDLKPTIIRLLNETGSCTSSEIVEKIKLSKKLNKKHIFGVLYGNEDLFHYDKDCQKWWCIG